MKNNRISITTAIFTLIILYSIVSLPKAFALDFRDENETGDLNIIIEPSIGYREDSLNWNIAGNIDGEDPNILSELEFNNLEIYQAGLELDIRENRIFLHSSLYYGEIIMGKGIDSDYDMDNRQDPFSISYSEINDDNILDLSVGIGYLFEFFHERIKIAPLLGVSHHKQNIRITNGVQILPEDIENIEGLNSTYQTEWKSAWIGANIMLEIMQGLFVLLSAQNHDAEYEAKADWNLREDFAHPVSFVHFADGEGLTIKTGIEKVFEEGWRIGLDYIGRNWFTDPGIDTVFFSDGATESTRLNKVTWKSESINLSFGYGF